MKTVIGLLSLLFLGAATAYPETPLRIASFSTILTELAHEIGGSHVKVAGLVGAGIDPHSYQPTPADLRTAAESQLILSSGRHLGGYIAKVGEASGGHAVLLQVGDSLPSAESGHGSVDPHWWHGIANMRRAVVILRDQLIALDPAHKADYESNAAHYTKQLDALATWTKRKIAEIPRDKRYLVTSHRAFESYGQDYGFTILSVEGVNPESEPSNRQVAELIDLMKQKQIKTLFLESTLNPKVTREITRETGATAGGTLYADGLGTGDASTYIGMMKHNISTIVDALK